MPKTREGVCRPLRDWPDTIGQKQLPHIFRMRSGDAFVFVSQERDRIVKEKPCSQAPFASPIDEHCCLRYQSTELMCYLRHNKPVVLGPAVL